MRQKKDDKISHKDLTERQQKIMLGLREEDDLELYLQNKWERF
jgi:hypothetical protein